MECLEKFAEMRDCMKQHPDLYDERDKEEGEVDLSEEGQANEEDEERKSSDVAKAKED